jgi:hypothetical protein
MSDRIAWAFYCRWPESWWLPAWFWDWLTDKLAAAINERGLLRTEGTSHE